MLVVIALALIWVGLVMGAVRGFWVLRQMASSPRVARGPVPSVQAVVAAEAIVRDAYRRLGGLYEPPTGRPGPAAAQGQQSR